MTKQGAHGRLEAGCFKSGAAGSVMTNARANAVGYDVLNICPLCGELGDSLHHRAYGCSKTRGRVSENVPEWFLNEAGRAPPSERFWTIGCFPHPEDDYPRPIEAIHPVFIGEGVDGEGRRTEQWELGCRIYIDGSCNPSPIRGLSREASGRGGDQHPGL